MKKKTGMKRAKRNPKLVLSAEQVRELTVRPIDENQLVNVAGGMCNQSTGTCMD